MNRTRLDANLKKLIKDFGLEGLSAVKLRNGYCIRPKGRLGTCGWENSKPWTASYVRQVPQGIEIEKD